eukprot:576283-Pleurochrysis_carterae.AAC.1
MPPHIAIRLVAHTDAQRHSLNDESCTRSRPSHSMHVFAPASTDPRAPSQAALSRPCSTPLLAPLNHTATPELRPFIPIGRDDYGAIAPQKAELGSTTSEPTSHWSALSPHQYLKQGLLPPPRAPGPPPC